MATRKKWTPKLEVDDNLLKFREKRKWQLALRRYVIEQQLSQQYAPYFGLSIGEFRKWIELQFTAEITWNNFGKAWQFDHIVPTAYFDYSIEEDLKLCWNFINIRVGKLELNRSGESRIDVLAAKAYFQKLFETTGYSFCAKMIGKISILETWGTIQEPRLENFLIHNKEYLETLPTLSHEEFNQLNTGMSLKDILLQREILTKFGN